MMKLSMFSLVSVVAAHREKCGEDTSGEKCPEYNTSGTSNSSGATDPLKHYSEEQIVALTECETSGCCTPTCTCVVTDQDKKEEWLNIPVTDDCCKNDCCKALTAISTLTAISEDSSVIYHIDLNLKSKKPDDDDDDDATDKASEVTTDVKLEDCPFGQIDCSGDQSMSGRIGLNSRFALQKTATTDEPASVDSSDVRFSAKASWAGSDPLAVCQQHEAYVVSGKWDSFSTVYRVEVPTVPTTEVDENVLTKGVFPPTNVLPEEVKTNEDIKISFVDGDGITT